MTDTLVMRPVGAAALALIICITLAGCATHQPTPSPTPDALSADESQTLIDEAIDQAWMEYGTPNQPRPEVPLVRTIEKAEWAEVMAGCMTTQGFAVTVGSDGGMASASLPSDQAEAYNLALFTCVASYPLDPKYDAPLNESQRRYLYDYLSHELVDCLEGEGYDIGSIPSWQRFTESLDGESMWTPFNDLSGISPKRFHEVTEACPQVPAGLYG